MPLSEVPQTAARENLESAHCKTMNYSPNLTPFMPDQEIVELLWDNGPIVMQSHSNRANKRLFTNTFPSHDVGFQERDGNGRDPIFPKVGHFGATADSMVNDFLQAVPSSHIGLTPQQDDMMTWLNYPINDDSLHTDYCSDFFSELTGVNSNSLSPHHNTVPGERTGGFDLSNMDSHNVEHQHVSKAVEGDSESSRIRTSQFFQLPQQCQSSAPIPKPRSVDFANGTNSSTHHQGQCGNLQDKFSQNQDPGNSNSKPIPPIGGIGLMNFPHFSRPVSLIKSNLQTVDRLRSHDKASTTTSSNPLESTVINSSSGFKSISRIQSKVTPAEKSEAIVQKDTQMNQHVSNFANINTRSPDHVYGQSSSLAAIQEFNSGPEPVVASSSVCSANSAGTESNDIKHTAKRKNREEETENRSEGSRDLEDESVSIKKQATGRGMSAKRSRAAEVHNLSERRRRDRINEKMRALQELIPNCNKVDKASMLDEAIEYLKTLQLQVQIMSMGSGLCMPPMMMQHLRPPHMAHFSPMGVNMGMGMGMGLGFGMGMVDMNGSPMVPVPPVHGPHFACPPMSSTGLQMFGIPGQGLNLNSSMPQAPHFSRFPGFSTRPGTLPNPLMVPDAAPSSNPTNKEQQGINLELKNTNTTDFKNQAPSQV